MKKALHAKVLPHRVDRRHQPVETRNERRVVASEPRAVGIRECCRRLDYSIRQAKRKLEAGTFPVSPLPRSSRREHLKFSLSDIEDFLLHGSMRDARVLGVMKP